jgi:hypothetical protein
VIPASEQEPFLRVSTPPQYSLYHSDFFWIHPSVTSVFHILYIHPSTFCTLTLSFKKSLPPYCSSLFRHNNDIHRRIGKEKRRLELFMIVHSKCYCDFVSSLFIQMREIVKRKTLHKIFLLFYLCVSCDWSLVNVICVLMEIISSNIFENAQVLRTIVEILPITGTSEIYGHR